MSVNKYSDSSEKVVEIIISNNGMFAADIVRELGEYAVDLAEQIVQGGKLGKEFRTRNGCSGLEAYYFHKD